MQLTNKITFLLANLPTTWKAHWQWMSLHWKCPDLLFFAIPESSHHSSMCSEFSVWLCVYILHIHYMLTSESEMETCFALNRKRALLFYFRLYHNVAEVFSLTLGYRISNGSLPIVTNCNTKIRQFCSSRIFGDNLYYTLTPNVTAHINFVFEIRLQFCVYFTKTLNYSFFNLKVFAVH